MAHWVKTWHMMPINQGCEFAELENMTQKLRIRNNVDADELRVQFVNLNKREPLFLYRVGVSIYEPETGFVGPTVPVTLGGKDQIVIPPGQTLYSDVCRLYVNHQDDILISVYFRKAQYFTGCMDIWNRGPWDSLYQEGDQVDSMTFEGKQSVEVFDFFGENPNPPACSIGVCGLLMNCKDDHTKTIALFGDSITHMGHYMNGLQEILYPKYPGRLSILNYGIGGNRILYDATYVESMPGHGIRFGPSGISRFEQDVYSEQEPDILFLLEGINDSMHGLQYHRPEEIPTGAEVFEGMKHFLRIAKKHKTKTIVGTVLPFKYAPADYDEPADQIRRELNALLRSEAGAWCEGVAELDALMNDPTRDGSILYDLQVGDGLHPNAAGGRKMAEVLAPMLEALL